MVELKLFVFCTMILVVICEESNNNQQRNTATRVIDNRSKRETESNIGVPYSNSKVVEPFIKRPKILRLVPITKAINPFKIFLNNTTPRRLIFPIASTSQNKSIETTNATTNKINENVDDTILSNDSQGIDVNEINDIIKQIHNSISANSSMLNDNESENKKENKEAPETSITMINEEINNKALKLIGRETNKSTSKEDKNSVSKNLEKDKIANLAIEKMSPNLNEAENNFRAKLVPKSKLITTSEKLSGRTADKLTIIAKENTSSEPTGNDTDPFKTADVVTELSLNSLPIIARVANILVPKTNTLLAPLTINPKISVANQSNDSVETILLRNIENENKPYHKNEIEVDLNSHKVEPNQEMLIQNNNYEKLFESSAPQHLSTKLITLELPPVQSHNFNPITAYDPFAPKNSNENASHFYNKPYSYDIKTYPDKYVVSPYDEFTNENVEKNLFEILKTNGNTWNQRFNSYNQPQINFKNYNFDGKYREQYPNKVWRSWKKNQVVFKPKSTSMVNIEELYAKGCLKNIGTMQIFNSRATFTNLSVRSHNISPYWNHNPSQLRKSNGY